MGVRMVKPVIVIIITAIVMLLTGFALGFEAGKKGVGNNYCNSSLQAYTTYVYCE
jgi:hypothetical protein